MGSLKKIDSIDIFCDIIDNYGDIGFVYRLATEIKKRDFNIKLRVFLNKLESFKVINKSVEIGLKYQDLQGITYYNLEKLEKSDYEMIVPAQVVIEAFACEIPTDYFYNYEKSLKLSLNLEYFTLEDWTRDFHLKTSFINLKGVKKYFYMPGLDESTGGIIIPKEFKTLNSDERKKFLEDLVKVYGQRIEGEVFINDEIIATVFSYEHNFIDFMEALELYSKNINKDVILLVFGEKSIQGFSNYNSLYDSKVKVIFMDYIEQEVYDCLLNGVDFNLVRGEESFVRALISGKPFLWHAYCQDEGVHMQKVEGYLKFIEKFFKSKKSFVNYSKIMYTYNSREFNNYQRTEINFYDFFEDLSELRKTFEELSIYIKSESDLVEKLLDFIKKQI